MYNIFLEALIDSAKTIPFLLLVYVVIELIELRFVGQIIEKVKQAGSAGPFIGAIAGVLPQCGFSVFTTALYNQRFVTLGTLMAVYLSTSDEAIPVILSQPEKAGIILPLVATKFIIAFVFGYLLDFIYKKNRQKILKHNEAYIKGQDDPSHKHVNVLEEGACCGHHVVNTKKELNIKNIFLHPLIHALKIFIYIFLVSFVINFSFARLSAESLANLFLHNNFFQPVLVALFGLIPNCAASVAITELYLKGIISYGSVIAGLCASGGLGILILFREERNKFEALKIVALLFAISVFVGLVM